MTCINPAGFRVRLYFSRNTCRYLGEKVEGCWYYVDRTKTRSISDLITDVSQCFHLPSDGQYSVTLEGLPVLSFSPISILEKDDSLKIKLLKKAPALNNHLGSVESLVEKAAATVPVENEIENVEALSPDGPKKKRRRKKKKPAVREIRTTLSQTLAALRDSAVTNEPNGNKVPTVKTASTLPKASKSHSDEPDASTYPTYLGGKSASTKRKHIRFDDDNSDQEETAVEVPSISKTAGRNSYPVLTKQFCQNEQQRNVSEVYAVSQQSKPKPARKTVANGKDSSDESSSESSEESSSSDAENGVQNGANGNENRMDDDGLVSPPRIGDPWKKLSKQLSSTNGNNSVDSGKKQPEKQMRSNGKAAYDNRSFGSTVSISDVTKLAPVKFPPKVSSVVSFKMLELSALFTPEVSARKTGRVLSVELETGLISLEMLVGSVAVPGDEDNPDKPPSKYATLSWSSMIDPRAVN